MSLEVYFLKLHLNCFYENLGDVSDEHSGRFHQDVAIIKKDLKGNVLWRCLQSTIDL